MNYIPNIKKIVFCFGLLFILASSLHSSQFIDWKQVVVAPNLPGNSAVVPSMSKTSEDQISIVFQSQKQYSGDFVLNFVMENSGEDFVEHSLGMSQNPNNGIFLSQCKLATMTKSE